MNELTWVLIAYGLLQVGSIVLLPRWWKVAAIPSLLVLWPIIDYYRTGGGYMGDVLTAMFAIYGCAWLVLVWFVVGITKLIRQAIRGVREPPP